MAFQIIPAHDPSVQIEFEVPIKGRQNPLSFSVPKLHFFPVEISDKYKEWFEAQVKAKKATDRACTLKLLELLAPKQYDTLAKLTDGEITQISKHWEEASKVGLGESSASSDS
ncbi:hypothetical protein [Cellulomonas sp. NPDC058312]|uniref:hypothetical protein n=1 Tax=Cellulomonas sp. NPDC058312 TaxID=3346441 RepID=UPI0036EEB2C1